MILINMSIRGREQAEGGATWTGRVEETEVPEDVTGIILDEV